MFPPISNNFLEEQTMNPHNQSEPTQIRTELDGTRAAVREELGKRSRALASEGMRYYNIFWVQKPLDEMERKYYQLKESGIGHDDAIRAALEMFHTRLSGKKRVAAIQAEEAKLSGNFITMREASSVLSALVHLEKKRATPHHAVELVERKAALASEAPLKIGTARWVQNRTVTLAAAVDADGDSEATPPTAVAEGDADGLFSFLEDSSGKMVVDTSDTPSESVAALREQATNRTGSSAWYGGSSPQYTVSK
eukprot:GILI01030443.1.p1 GENE.GILI01030443.1~~GILI01030443.1.p1  ORF type:complete len:282 (-),score=38.03 GILI01030443.1:46-801(-)